jgi:K+-sensing histidine kinase KdpD
MTARKTNRTPIDIAPFIEDVAAAGRLAAEARGVTLIVPSVEDGLMMEGDQRVLAAVIANLLQNAFKFTRPHSRVTLRVVASAERLLIEVEDECGGLPGVGDVDEMPATFEQRGADRSGWVLDWPSAAGERKRTGGRLYARNRPAKGCVFTVDLPRSPVLAIT